MIEGIKTALTVPSVREKETNTFRTNVNQRAGESDAVSVALQKRTTSGSALDISSAKSSAEIASQAANDIFELRKEQLELAKKADDSPSPGDREAIQEEIETLQAEIERVAEEAVDENGNSVLTSSGTTLSNDEVLQRSDISAIADDPNVDLSTQASAEAAVETLEEATSTAFRYSEVADSTLNKAEQVLKEEVAVEQKRRLSSEDAIKTEEDAAKIAEQVSNQIVQRFGNEQDPGQSLTDTLISGEPNTEPLTA